MSRPMNQYIPKAEQPSWVKAAVIELYDQMQVDETRVWVASCNQIGAVVYDDPDFEARISGRIQLMDENQHCNFSNSEMYVATLIQGPPRPFGNNAPTRDPREVVSVSRVIVEPTGEGNTCLARFAVTEHPKTGVFAQTMNIGVLWHKQLLEAITDEEVLAIQILQRNGHKRPDPRFESLESRKQFQQFLIEHSRYREGTDANPGGWQWVGTELFDSGPTMLRVLRNLFTGWEVTSQTRNADGSMAQPDDGKERLKLPFLSKTNSTVTQIEAKAVDEDDQAPFAALLAASDATVPTEEEEVVG